MEKINSFDTNISSMNCNEVLNFLLTLAGSFKVKYFNFFNMFNKILEDNLHLKLHL